MATDSISNLSNLFLKRNIAHAQFSKSPQTDRIDGNAVQTTIIVRHQIADYPKKLQSLFSKNIFHARKTILYLYIGSWNR